MLCFCFEIFFGMVLNVIFDVVLYMISDGDMSAFIILSICLFGSFRRIFTISSFSLFLSFNTKSLHHYLIDHPLY